MIASVGIANSAQAAINLRTAMQFAELPVAVTAGMVSSIDGGNRAFREIFNMFGMNWMPDFSTFTDAMAETVNAAHRLATPYRRAAFAVPGAQIEMVMDFTHLQMLHFKTPGCENRPKLLLVISMSGHQPAALNDTILGLIRYFDVHVSAPVCASQVAEKLGLFSVDDYRSAVMDMMEYLKNPHVIAVSQAGKPTLEAVALQHATHKEAPQTLTLMGCPIDARINPQLINRLTEGKSLQWFRDNTLAKVERGLPGAGRLVRPGYLQDETFKCVSSNGREAPKDMAPADLDAGYYIQTIDEGFIRHTLATGKSVHIDRQGRTHEIRLDLITRTAIMSVEGEHDDIAGPGQTVAVHDLCKRLSPTMKHHYLQVGAGHYGIITGKPWLTSVAPQVINFIASHNRGPQCVPSFAA